MNLDIDISLDHPKKDSKASTSSGSNLNKSVLDKYYNNNHSSSSRKSYSTNYSYFANEASKQRNKNTDKKFLDELYEDYSVSTYKKKIAAQNAFNRARKNARNVNNNQYGDYTNNNYLNNNYSNENYSNNNYSNNNLNNNYNNNNNQAMYSYSDNTKSRKNYSRSYYSNNRNNNSYANNNYEQNYYSHKSNVNDLYYQNNYVDNTYIENGYQANYSENNYSENNYYNDNNYFESRQNVSDKKAKIQEGYDFNNSVYNDHYEENPVTVYYRKKQKESDSSYNAGAYDDDYFEINEKTAKELIKEEEGFSKYSEKIQQENHTPILDARSDMLNTAMIDVSSHVAIDEKREQKFKKQNKDVGKITEDKPNYLEKVISKCKERINRISEDEDEEEYFGKTQKGELPGRNFEADLDDSIEAYRKRSKERKSENNRRRKERQSADNIEKYSATKKKKRREKNEYEFSDGTESSGVEVVLKLAIAVVVVAIIMVLVTSIMPGKSVEAGTDVVEVYELISTNDIANVSENASVIEESENKENKENKIEEKAPKGPYGASDPAAYGFFDGYEVFEDENTGYIYNEEVASTYGVLIDLKDGRIVAQKNAKDKIYPASMTKVMTLLVAVENIENLEDTVTITQEDTDYAYSKGLSAVNWDIGEEVTVKDLLYGTILPSGGDAAHALATYIAGTEDDFVVMMNDKLKELGLSETTHFTNCSGFYDDNHYSRMVDIAMILKAAESNELCREVLDARRYKTSMTSQHSDGIDLSNLFLRRIEDKDTHGEVHGAKTGFVNESGCCAVSYAKSNDGNQYICVTGNAYSSWRCIYDHVQIYDDYTN